MANFFVFVILILGIYFIVRSAKVQKLLRSEYHKAQSKGNFITLKNEQDPYSTQVCPAFSNVDVAKFFSYTVVPGLYTVRFPKGYFMVSSCKYLTLDHEGDLQITVSNGRKFLHIFVKVRMPLAEKVNRAVYEYRNQHYQKNG